ncbi:MAG: DUF945 domain-containing protein [Patescibacteria group bacterium]|nr:DUF945 domain-containing protein [Patescibacteria group bacterium]
MQTKDYSFPVKTEPLFAGKLQIPGKMAVIREDTNESLGIVSKHYGLLEHKVVINSFRDILKEHKVEEKIELQKNGAQLFATYTFLDTQIKVAEGDFLSMTLIAKNSYDSSSSFQIMLGAFRLVCSNGMIIGQQFFKYNQRHFTDNIQIDMPELKENLTQMTAKFKNSLPIMQRMVDTEMSQSITDILEREVKSKNLPKYLGDIAEESYETKADFSVWGYYNALTYSITHEMKKDKPAARNDYLQRAWESAETLIAQ